MIEIENFLDNPYLVREYALQQDYQECKFECNKPLFSGFRCLVKSKCIFNEIFSKIEQISNLKIHEIHMSFHVNSEISVLGFPHHDSSYSPEVKEFAGVIYLNELPMEMDKFLYGTTMYENPDYIPDDYISKMQIVYNVNIPCENFYKLKFIKECLDYKSKLKIIKNLGLEFNKLVMYSAHDFHSPNFYFGSTLEDSRMTIAIHGKFK